MNEVQYMYIYVVLLLYPPPPHPSPLDSKLVNESIQCIVLDSSYIYQYVILRLPCSCQ